MDALEMKEVVNEVWDWLVTAGAEAYLLERFNTVIEHISKEWV